MAVRLPGTPSSWLDKEIAKEEEMVFTMQLDDALKSGCYPIHVAAILIAKSAGFGVSSTKIENRLINDARNKILPVFMVGQTLQWEGDKSFISLLEIHWDDLNKWLEDNEKRIVWRFDPPMLPYEMNMPSVTKAGMLPEMHTEVPSPWQIADPKDPPPKQQWYIPARYFARQLVKEDSTLLTKKPILAKKVAQSLNSVGIKKRGGKLPLEPGTVLKAFSNVSLG